LTIIFDCDNFFKNSNEVCPFDFENGAPNIVNVKAVYSNNPVDTLKAIANVAEMPYECVKTMEWDLSHAVDRITPSFFTYYRYSSDNTPMKLALSSSCFSSLNPDQQILYNPIFLSANGVQISDLERMDIERPSFPAPDTLPKSDTDSDSGSDTSLDPESDDPEQPIFDVDA
jgi:hypothetical protein